MTSNHKICLNFLIFGCIGQLTIIQRLNCLKISVDKQEVKSHVVDYVDYMNKLKELIKMKTSKWQTLLQTRVTTKVCGRNSAQLLTLCQWIANSEPYIKSQFILVRLKRFLSNCYPYYFRLTNEKDQRSVEMVACPYIKKRILDSGLNDERLAVQPGVLFVTGCMGENSALVFISHRRNNEIVYEPSGYVTQVDMKMLKNKSNFKKAVSKAMKMNKVIENLRIAVEESKEVVKVSTSEPPQSFENP